MDDMYYIAIEDYSLPSVSGRSIDICIGNQFVLLEELNTNLWKLKRINSSCSDISELILPSYLFEEMSKPSYCKPSLILSRSKSVDKERSCSLDLENKVTEDPTKMKYSTFGHSTLTDEISKSSRSRTLPAAVMLSTSPVFEYEARKSVMSEPCDSSATQSESDSKWTCAVENGRQVYTNIESGERWYSAYDEAGQQYYYSEVSQQSSWVLPGSDWVNDQYLGDEAVRQIDDVLENMRESSDSEVSCEDDFEGGDNIKVDSVRPRSNIPEIQNQNNRFNVKHIGKQHISGPLFNKLMRTERAGPCEKTKFLENGREVSKKWANFHLVLTGPELLFYKDMKAVVAKPGMPQGKVELKLKIQNLEISEKVEATGKVSLLQIDDKGAPGSSVTYLLRLSSFDEMLAWKTALQFAKNWQNDNMYSNTSLKLEPGLVNDSSGDKQNIGIKLKQFLKKRPTRENLEARGILKSESVFGSTLELLCEQEKRKVPEFVFRCILAIEARGLNQNGIYRVSGNLAKIQKLRLAVDENKYQLNSESIELETLTGALKSFFKELKEPLFDDEFCTKMVEILSTRKSDRKNPYRDVNQSSVKKLVSKLKSCHYETAKALLGHLHRVAALSHQNLMDVSNLSMVWGPNLYLVSGQASTQLAVILMMRNQVVDYLLTFYSELFEKT